MFFIIFDFRRFSGYTIFDYEKQENIFWACLLIGPNKSLCPQLKNYGQGLFALWG
jgi:hypothetical protein